MEFMPIFELFLKAKTYCEGHEMELFQFGDILKNEIVNTLDSTIVVLYSSSRKYS